MMPTAFIQVIVMLHAAFAVVFIFMNRQSPSRFARLFSLSWLIEGVRAAILLEDLRAFFGGVQGHWFAVADVLCFFANWYLLAGCAELVGVKLRSGLKRWYFGLGIPVVLLNRYALVAWVPASWGFTEEQITFVGMTVSLSVMFVPVAVARLFVVVWFFQWWRKTGRPGALIATTFGVPYAVMALLVPILFYYSSSPDWFYPVWCLRVLGFSIGLIMLMFDVQQASLVKSEANLAAAQALAKVGSWELDVPTGEAIWSAEMYRLFGRAPREGVMSYDAFLATIHPEDRPGFRSQESQAIAERRGSALEFRIIRPDGVVRWIHGRTTPNFGPDGRLIRLMGVQQDITDRKRGESRTALQHAITQVLAEAQPLAPTVKKILEIAARGLEADHAAFWTVDRASGTLGCMELWHRPERPLTEFTRETLAVTYAAGVGLPGRLLAERQPVFLTEDETANQSNYPRRHAAARAGLRGASGFPILLRSEIYGVVEFFHTEARSAEPEMVALFSALGIQIGQFIERQRLEDQYRHSQKMEAVGTLAGGIAHDFNNILTAIQGYCELAHLEAPDDSPIRPHLDAVRTGARRATDLVRQIMAFSRQQEQQRRPVRLTQVVDEALRLLRATIPATVEMKTHHAPDLPLVLADATSIHQVILNLGTNASYAMKDRPGRMEVALTRTVADQDFVATHPGLRVGEYVTLKVSDTGTGMDAATMARIFEPFFTTKPPGEGTGLGLAVVHGIMQSHEGAVFVQSQLGIGTTFSLHFPAYWGEVATEESAIIAQVPRGRGQRVLYIDDEPPLAEMGKKILERLGYVVEVHGVPDDALGALGARPDAFDLLITDLTMPGMSGLELAQAALRIRPGLPIILTSGYTATLTTARFREIGIREFLMKPHSVDSLGIAVSRVLRRSPSRPGWPA